MKKLIGDVMRVRYLLGFFVLVWMVYHWLLVTPGGLILDPTEPTPSIHQARAVLFADSFWSDVAAEVDWRMGYLSEQMAEAEIDAATSCADLISQIPLDASNLAAHKHERETFCAWSAASSTVTALELADEIAKLEAIRAKINQKYGF